MSPSQLHGRPSCTEMFCLCDNSRRTSILSVTGKRVRDSAESPTSMQLSTSTVFVHEEMHRPEAKGERCPQPPFNISAAVDGRDLAAALPHLLSTPPAAMSTANTLDLKGWQLDAVVAGIIDADVPGTSARIDQVVELLDKCWQKLKDSMSCGPCISEWCCVARLAVLDGRGKSRQIRRRHQEGLVKTNASISIFLSKRERIDETLHSVLGKALRL